VNSWWVASLKVGVGFYAAGTHSLPQQFKCQKTSEGQFTVDQGLDDVQYTCMGVRVCSLSAVSAPMMIISQ